MSGITGIYYPNGREVDRNLLQRMTSSIAHRGSDGEGFYLSGNLGLGHRRLATVDLSKAGHQPMVSEDDLLAIVHDGQVYNAPEIRQDLERIGYRFRSKTDTEVILNSYKEWGEGCLNKFNGMWSFAIWDKLKNRLFCARDRFGAKPFYYYFDSKVFIFASEIKALLVYPSLNKMVNEEAVYDYLVWGVYEYSEGTFFKGIKELRPSHYLLLDSKDGLGIKRWWNLQINPGMTILSQSDSCDAVGKLRLLLEDSVKIRLGADVPIGTCLSGGLDSSSIAVLAHKLMPDENPTGRQIIGAKERTFSSCYQDKHCDERLYIEKVLQATGAEGNYVFPDADSLWKELPEVIWHNDEPLLTATPYARRKIMQRAKELGVKVLLGGDGADVLLADHRYYGSFLIGLALKGKLRWLLAEVKNTAAVIGAQDLASSLATVLRGVGYFQLPAPVQLSTRNSFFSLRGRNAHRILNQSYDSRFSRHGLARMSQEYSETSNSFQEILYRDSLTITSTLQSEDRSSSAFSIESRAPFLDYRMVDFCFSLPVSLKIHNGWTKWILREAMQGILPEEIRLRKDKRGFPIPTRTWLKSNREQIRALFSSGDVLSSQFINPGFIVDNIDYLLDRRMSVDELWRSVNLELWLRVFFGDGQQLLKR